jgi:hypothetical protein
MNHELPDHRHPHVLTILLTHHLTDQAPGPTIPKWQKEQERGFTSQDWITCPTCHGSGERTWKHRTVRCDHPTCQGEGGWHGDEYNARAQAVHAEHAPMLDVLTYTQTLIAYLDDTDHAAWRLCRTTFARRGAIADPDDLALQLGIHATLTATEHQQHSCYTHLDQALEQLPTIDPFAALAIHRQHTLNDLPWDADWQDDYRRALTHTARILGPRFRAPRWAREQAHDQNAA